MKNTITRVKGLAVAGLAVVACLSAPGSTYAQWSTTVPLPNTRATISTGNLALSPPTQTVSWADANNAYATVRVSLAGQTLGAQLCDSFVNNPNAPAQVIITKVGVLNPAPISCNTVLTENDSGDYLVSVTVPGANKTSQLGTLTLTLTQGLSGQPFSTGNNQSPVGPWSDTATIDLGTRPIQQLPPSPCGNVPGACLGFSKKAGIPSGDTCQISGIPTDDLGYLWVPAGSPVCYVLTTTNYGPESANVLVVSDTHWGGQQLEYRAISLTEIDQTGQAHEYPAYPVPIGENGYQGPQYQAPDFCILYGNQPVCGVATVRTGNVAPNLTLDPGHSIVMRIDAVIPAGQPNSTPGCHGSFAGDNTWIVNNGMVNASNLAAGSDVSKIEAVGVGTVPVGQCQGAFGFQSSLETVDSGLEIGALITGIEAGDE